MPLRRLRRLLPLALVLALLGAGAAFAATPPPGIPATGSVYVTTLPSGADVWLDGAYLGHTPKLIDGLALGRHALTVVKAGWQGRDLALTIADPAAPVTASVVLDKSDAYDARGSGALVLHGSTPLPPSILVDGSPVALTKGSCTLPVGLHTVAISTARGRMTRRVTIYADMTTEIIVREEPDNEGAK
jgi:hypothetical protein